MPKPLAITDNLKREFIKDENLPFPVAEEPFFSYYLDLFDPILSTRRKFATFCEAVQHLGGESGFHKHIKTVVDKATRAITEHPAYASLTAENIAARFAECVGYTECSQGIPGVDVYTMQVFDSRWT